MLTIAFKEWAAVCRALAAGQQSVILRKGGIAETAGQFTPDHGQFWLYPTFFHEQQQAGLKPDFLHYLSVAEADRPEPGTLRLTHWAEVQQIEYLTDWEQVAARQAEHIWNGATVRQRFDYRKPGLYFLTVKVQQAVTPLVLPERPEYAGCKTWVELVLSE